MRLDESRLVSLLHGRAIRRGGLPSLLFPLLLVSGCAGTVPYTTAPEYETTQIQGTQLWVVWPSRESVQSLEYYEAMRSDPSQVNQSFIADSSVLTDDLMAEYVPQLNEYTVVSDPPRPISTFEPRYPLDAQLAGKEGTVWIKALVLQDGYVGEARVAQRSGTDFDFERAALEAAMLYSYSPARYYEEKVDCWVTYPVQFRIKRQ